MNKTTISVSRNSESHSYVLIYAVFALLLAVCPLYCLMSAFKLNVNSSVLIFWSVLFTGVFSALATFVKSTRRYTACVCVVFVVFAVAVWLMFDRLSGELNYVINSVLGRYAKYLNCVSRVTFADYLFTATELFVMISIALSFLMTFLLIRIRSVFFAIVIPIIVITPCFVLVNTLPNLFVLLVLITILLTLFACSYICRINASHSSKVVPVVAFFMAMLVTVVSVIAPVQGYQRNEWQDNMLETATDLLSSFEGGIVTSEIKIVEKELDLSQSGPLRQTHKKVMTVNGDYEGRLYLRGFCYANYEYNKWSLLTDLQSQNLPSDFDSLVMTKSSVPESTISIETNSKEEVLYTPYFLSQIPASGKTIFDILVKNNNGTKDYDVSFSPCEINDPFFDDGDMYYYADMTSGKDEYRRFVYENYLTVPLVVRNELIKMASNSGFNFESTPELVESVREFVSNSASYSLDTPQVPYGKDIALWLLIESDTGYCVHFATAATLMLRSLGIPARYVSGYCVDLDKDNPNSKIVTTDNAHAWVEYYDDNIGWVPFDATPSDFTVAVYTPSAKELQQQKTEQYTTDEDETETTQNATKDDGSAKRAHKDSGTNNVLSAVIITIISAGLLVLTLIIRRKIILYVRCKNFTTGPRNRRAKYIYRYLLALSKNSHLYVPEGISDIADKARFSQKQITGEELSMIKSYVDERKKAVETDSVKLKKLYLKYILAVI